VKRTNLQFNCKCISLYLLLMILAAVSATLTAQTGGQGALQGTVTDSSGALVSDATVTATDQASGVSTTRKTSTAALYTINTADSRHLHGNGDG
jgi:hypothetical protein